MLNNLKYYYFYTFNYADSYFLEIYQLYSKGIIFDLNLIELGYY